MKPALQTTPLLVAVIVLFQVVVVNGQNNPCPVSCHCPAHTTTVECNGNMARSPFPTDTTILTIQQVSTFTTINTTLFASLTQLTNLYVIDNGLNWINGTAFVNNHRLVHLNLSENQLTQTSLPAINHRSLQNLRVLDLSGNQHMGNFLSERPFENLHRLKVLRLDRCGIRWINASSTFEGLEVLDELSLTNNYLSYLPDDIFNQLGSREHFYRLYLDHNNFNTLNGQRIFSLFGFQRQYYAITLHYNPWNCTCELYQNLYLVWNRLIDRETTYLVYPTCQSPPALYRRFWHQITEDEFCPPESNELQMYLIAAIAFAFTILMMFLAFCIYQRFSKDGDSLEKQKLRKIKQLMRKTTKKKRSMWW